MDNLEIEKTKRTPAINFDFSKCVFSMTGESYPEDINQFYGEIITTFKSYLAESKDQTLVFNFDLIYFNSSSAKVMMQIFDMLEAAAKNNTVQINWLHEEEDDNMAELGEEFGEDLENAAFQLKVKETEKSEN